MPGGTKPVHTKCFIIFVATLILPMSTAIAAPGDNPFLSTAGQAAEPTVQDQSPVENGKTSFLPPALVEWQRQLYFGLADLLGRIAPDPEGNRDWAALGFLLLVAFLYGLLHALGPGHGKAVISAMVMSRSVRAGQIVLAGALVALLHATVAITVVLVLTKVLEAVFSLAFASVNRALSLASFGLLAIVGLWMLVDAIVVLKSGGRKHLHLHLHSKTDQDEASADQSLTPKQLLAMVVSVGAVPCPGSSTLLLLAFGLGAAEAGIVGVLSLSLGVGVLVTVVGLGVMLVRKGILKASGALTASGANSLLPRLLGLAGAGMVFLFALTLFLGQL